MEKKEKSKSIIGIVVTLISVLAIVGLIYAGITLNKKSEEEDKSLVTITYKELDEKINNKDSFILVISRTDCSHCASFKPKLKSILSDNNIIAYEIATDTLSESESKKFKKLFTIQGTPTTVFITEGEETTVSNRLIGDVSSSKITERLKSLGYIKE